MIRVAPMLSIIARSASPRRRPCLIALFLLAIAISGCAKQGESREARLARANEKLAAGQYAKAEAEYREILRAAPNDPQAVRQLGLLYHDQGQALQAVPLLRKSAEL